MNIGDVVMFKGLNLTNSKNIGYIYIVSEKSKEVKVEWNFGAYEWEHIDNLEVLDMNNEENINLFKELFIKNQKNKNSIKNYDDYLEWVSIYNGKYGSSEDIFTFCNRTYEKVEFLKYDGNNIIDEKFNRKYFKAYSKDKFLVYTTKANGCYYSCRVAYLVNKDNNNVYFVGIKHTSPYNGKYCPYKALINNIENYYYKIETPEYQKQKDRESIKNLYHFLYGDKSYYIEENNIVTVRQVIYIGELMDALYTEFIKKNQIEYIDKFTYNADFELYLLNTTDLFKNMNCKNDINNAINKLKIKLCQTINMENDNINEYFNENIQSFKDYYIL